MQYWLWIMIGTCNIVCIPDTKHQGLLQPQGTLVGHSQIIWCQISQRSASRFWGRPLGHRGSQGHQKPLGHLCWYPVAGVMTEGSSGTHTQSLESNNFALRYLIEKPCRIYTNFKSWFCFYIYANSRDLQTKRKLTTHLCNKHRRLVADIQKFGMTFNIKFQR